MLWVKAFHVIFVVTWFAGLFYLPRLFVYHAQAEDQISLDRFVVMERKLFIIMTIGAVLSVLFGVWLLAGYAWAAYASSTFWMPVKLLLALLLLVYHGYCYVLMRAFREGRNQHSHVFYSWVNEVPALALLAIVILAVVKPV